MKKRKLRKKDFVVQRNPSKKEKNEDRHRSRSGTKE